MAAATTLLVSATTARADDRQHCASAADQGQQLRDDGKYRRAREQLLVCAREVCPAPIRRDCLEWLTQVESTAPTVVFGAKEGLKDLSEVKIYVDGAAVADRLDGKPVQMDLGKHTVRFEYQGQTKEEEIVVGAGQKNRNVTMTFGAALTPTAPTPQNAAPPATVEPPAEAWNIKDVEELPGKRYLFIGARYRGNIIPQFMLKLFVDEGATIYSNSIGIELDLRKDGFSLIPALSFSEYGTGDILFKEKGSKDFAGNYSFVNSSMKALYATVDLLWSAKISKNFDFEYGAGFGLGILFGDLRNNWVYQVAPGDPNQAFTSETGLGLAKCPAGGTQPGCNSAEHKNTDILKVGDYKEPGWLDGGSKPVIFPWISIPQIGIRYKPVKNFVARLGMGFALTGFWFGLNGAYGLEQKPKP